MRRIASDLGPIDRVMNAAAIMPTELLVNQDADLVNRVMAINYGGTVNVTMAVARHARARIRRSRQLRGGGGLAAHPALRRVQRLGVRRGGVHRGAPPREPRPRRALRPRVPGATPLLDQAKSQPKILAELPPIAPDRVLDAIERDLERGKLMVYPDRNAAFVVWARRHFPRLTWWNVHRVEGV